MKTIKQYICIAFLFLTVIATAQAPRKFYTKFGGNGYDVGYDVKQTFDKGYIITGSTSSFGAGNTDLYLAKLDSMGHQKFENFFGGYNNEIGKSVVQLADSGYAMVGYSNSSGFGGYDIFLVRVDKTGSLLWQKTLGGSDWDFAYSLKSTNDGGFIIAGTTYSFGYGNADGYVIKTDANGNVQWSKNYGGKKDDEFKSVIQTMDGNYALTGYTKSYNDSLGDIWAFKLDPNGDSITCKFLVGNKEDFGNEIIEHPTNTYFYIAGATASYGSGMLDAYAVITDNSFSQLAGQVDGHPNSNEVFNSVVIPLSNPSYSAWAETDNISAFGVQTKIIILTPVLSYVFATGYGDVREDEIYKIITTKDSGFACVGYTKSYNAILSDVYFIKMDSTILNSQNIISVKENEDAFAGLDIYPNPCQDYIYVKAETKKINSIQLIDVLGNSIYIDHYKPEPANGTIKINTGDISNGIYFLKINSSINKIIIEH